MTLRLPGPTAQSWGWAAAGTAAGVAALASGWSAPVGVQLEPAILAVGLVAAIVTDEWSTLRLSPSPGTSVTGYLSGAKAVAAIVLPVGMAAVVVAGGTLITQSRNPAVKRRFNVGVDVCAVVVAGAVARVWAGADPTSLTGLAAVALATAAFEVVSVTAVTVVVRAVAGRPADQAVRTGATLVVGNVAQVTVIVALLAVHWLLALASLVPLAAARRAWALLERSEIEKERTSAVLERVSQAVAGVRDTVLVCSHDGRVLLASPSAETLLDASRLDDSEPAFDDVALLTEDGRPIRFDMLVADARERHGRAVRHLSLHPPRHGAPERFVLALVTVHDDDDGDGTVVVALHDRTAQVQRDRTKDAFLAAVSHELRTPLTPILSHAQMLARFRSQMDDTEIDEALEAIADRARHLLAVLEDQLQVAQSGTSRGPGVAVATDLVALAQSVAEDVAMAHPAHDIRVREAQPADPSVQPMVERDAVRQVLVNLVANACKYSPPGPVDLVVHQPGSVDPHHMAVDVVDHGHGIAPDDQDRVFGQFERAVAGTSGAGLGLHIARRLAVSIGGEVTLESSGPAGSTFRLWVPASPSGQPFSPPIP